MMSIALHTATEELSLVLFTTLAPSGAAAIIAIALVLLLGKLDGAERGRIITYLWVPLVLTMVGLVASATHLGNPANALYVFSRVGASPLSTEVFTAVLFLGTVAAYWLHSFARRPRPRLQRALLAAAVVTGLVFLASVALAYAVDTIIGWDTVFVPWGTLANALVGGPPIALLTFCVAGADGCATRWQKPLLALSTVALAANIALLAAQNAGLSAIGNSFATVADLVPFYGALIAAFGVLAACGIGGFWSFALRRRLPGTATAALLVALVLAGIFAVRFGFYLMHLTAGMGLSL